MRIIVSEYAQYNKYIIHNEFGDLYTNDPYLLLFEDNWKINPYYFGNPQDFEKDMKMIMWDLEDMIDEDMKEKGNELWRR